MNACTFVFLFQAAYGLESEALSVSESRDYSFWMFLDTTNLLKMLSIILI